MIRLDRFLANMGIGTRKEVKKLVSSGVVTVNNIPAKDCGMQIDENKDCVCVANEKIEYKPFVYIMMNKPAGVLSASEDAHGAVTAADIVFDEYGHYGVSPAGRLDKDSEGFLILTNDGDYIHKVISPNKKVDKVYFCLVEKEITLADIEAFKDGIILGDGTECLPAALERAPKEMYEDGENGVLVTIHEGKFHQVKRMFLSRNNKVLYLKRLKIGEVELDESLKAGEYREMTFEEKESIINE
ncbi:MAG: rRNA pseudouridine synthase [Ruminococcaceae bacterium]|nr:rRNA pseudouridine synthase [Oscillospiraceae bacterium]